MAGPTRTSPSVARHSPYTRKSLTTKDSIAAAEPSGLITGILRKGLRWWRGSNDGEAVNGRDQHDEEDALEGVRLPSLLQRSRTMPGGLDGSRDMPPPRKSNKMGAPSTPSLPARTPATDGNDSLPRLRTKHSVLDINPRPSSRSRSPQLKSTASVPSIRHLANGHGSHPSAVFGAPPPLPHLARDEALVLPDPYAATLQPHSPFRSPSISGLSLRSPSPGARSRGHALYPYSSGMKRTFGPLDAPSTSASGSTLGAFSSAKRHLAWSPSREVAPGGLSSAARSTSSYDSMSVPQNEAERILEQLESMRTPLGRGGSGFGSRVSAAFTLSHLFLH